MKKIFSLTSFIVFLFLAVPAFSQENAAGKWNFSLEGKFGARLGVYDEIVWADRTSDGLRYKESELNYELAPVFYTGFDFCASTKRIELKFLSKFFVPQRSGALKDSDWQNDAWCSNGDIYTKTDYSEHSLSLNSIFAGIAGYDFEIQGGYKFYPTNFFTLTPLLSFFVQCMNFQAAGGIGWYGNYNSERNRIASYADVTSRTVFEFGSSPVIEYKVYNMFLWTGVRADFNILSNFSLSLASEVSLLSILLDFDRHLTNKRDFKEVAFSGFFAFRQTIRTEIKLQDNLSFCQACSFLITRESDGTMYWKKSEEGDYKKILNAGGGNQIVSLDLELSLKISW